MSRAALLLLPLVLGCGSPGVEDAPFERLLDVETSGTGLVPLDDALAIPIDESWRTNRAIPDGIRERLASGHDCLVLREPVVFAGAARWIVDGVTPFRPSAIELRAAHDRRDDELGRDSPLRPALLQIRGALRTDIPPDRYGIDKLASVSLAELGLDGGIKAIDSRVDRVALGRGIETSMRIVTNRIGDDTGQTSYDWLATYKDGRRIPEAEWLAAIDLPAAERGPYKAIVRLYRGSAAPEVWYAVPLNVVLLCSQMRLERTESGAIGWRWEGFWLGRLEKAPGSGIESRPPTVRVVYAEFRSAEGQRQGGDYLSTVFDPITRTGRTALDELRRRSAAAFLPGED